MGRLLVEATEAAILTSIKAATKNERFGLPSKWDGVGDLSVALNVAKMSGSHKMAACLHRAKASVHREKARLRTDRANMFARLHNNIVAESGSAGGMHKRFATEEAHAAQQELFFFILP